MLLFLLSFWIWIPKLWVLFLFLVPLIVDGIIQKKTSYESNNLRRLWTGILYGYAIVGLIGLFLASGYHQGFHMAEKWSQ